MTERYVVMVRGKLRSRHTDAMEAESEAAKLRSMGFAAHARGVHADAERKRGLVAIERDFKSRGGW